MYVRVFVSLTRPHVLPLYVPDKLLAREVAYQIVGNGRNKALKESKKSVWPPFPIHCGVYVMDNFKHVVLKINQIQCLNFPIIPSRKYDPNKVAKNFTAQVKVR